MWDFRKASIQRELIQPGSIAPSTFSPSGLRHRRDCGALAAILDLPHELVKNTYMGTAKRQVPGSLMTLAIV